MTPWTMGLNILYGIGIAAIFGLSIVLEQSGALSLAYVLGVLLFVFDLFGPLKALYGEASRPVSYTHLDVYKRQPLNGIKEPSKPGEHRNR